MANLKVPVGPADHTLSDEHAPVTLVEYGDYECPHCGHAHPVVKEVQRILGDDLRFVFRNFPLTQIHEHAQKAHEAAEAAGAQGKYWEYHDLLFENQQHLERSHLIDYATRLQLDEPRFTHDVDTNAYVKRIRADFASGIESGVNGTPTFFINGSRYDDMADVESLVEALRAAVD